MYLYLHCTQCYRTGTAGNPTFFPHGTLAGMHSGSGFGSGSNMKWNAKVKK
jgi:hypothetical protein